MISTAKAQNELNEIKKHVIGIHEHHKVFSLVMNFDRVNNTVDLCRITNFGAIQKEFNHPLSVGNFQIFPNSKTMDEMLNNPFEWADFMVQFN